MEKQMILKPLVLISLMVALALAVEAQQSGVPAQPNAGQATQPPATSNGPGAVGSDLPAANAGQSTNAPAAANNGADTSTNANPTAGANQDNGAQTQTTGTTTNPASNPTTGPVTVTSQGNGDDNPYDPLLEPPPMPKGKTTLVGGLAVNVDHVRNRLLVQPFGGGKKMRIVIDERSHLYRNGAPTTILGIHKGDHVYVDTMLSQDNKIFARNVRVITETEMAEVRGQVLSTNPEKGTVNVRDQLSSRPVSFVVNNATQYSSTKGDATASDLQPGSLIDVQFSPRSDRATAKEIKILAKPGDNYIFSGVVTNVDMRTNSFFVDNKSDDQSYEVHFSPAALTERSALRVGSQVTARAVFDGKEYVASNVRVESAETGDASQTKAQ